MMPRSRLRVWRCWVVAAAGLVAGALVPAAMPPAFLVSAAAVAAAGPPGPGETAAAVAGFPRVIPEGGHFSSGSTDQAAGGGDGSGGGSRGDDTAAPAFAAVATPPPPIDTAPDDYRHQRLYQRLRERGATDDELQSVRGLHNTIRSLRATAQRQQQQQRHRYAQASQSGPRSGFVEGGSSSSSSGGAGGSGTAAAAAVPPSPLLPELHAEHKRDAVHALREILGKYGVAPSLDGRKKPTQHSPHDEAGAVAKLRRLYLDATSVEEREEIMREISQTHAQRRLSMPAHGYRLHKPRPKPVLRDSEKLDYESSGLVHREEVRWIRQRILAAESDEERDALRAQLDAMMRHARNNRRAHLLEKQHQQHVVAAAIETGNGVPEPVGAAQRLGMAAPTKQKRRPAGGARPGRDGGGGLPAGVRPRAKAKANAKQVGDAQKGTGASSAAAA